MADFQKGLCQIELSMDTLLFNYYATNLTDMLLLMLADFYIVSEAESNINQTISISNNGNRLVIASYKFSTRNISSLTGSKINNLNICQWRMVLRIDCHTILANIFSMTSLSNKPIQKRINLHNNLYIYVLNTGTNLATKVEIVTGYYAAKIHAMGSEVIVRSNSLLAFACRQNIDSGKNCFTLINNLSGTASCLLRTSIVHKRRKEIR